jgi:BolA family transcriptional regulator, general stress-responsive regulator
LRFRRQNPCFKREVRTRAAATNSIWEGGKSMSIGETIETRLNEALQPERLEVINESHLHAGHHHVESGHHATFDGSGETHFRVRVVSARFAGMSRIERHRTVNALLEDQMSLHGLHALAIEPAAPGEATRW